MGPCTKIKELLQLFIPKYVLQCTNMFQKICSINISILFLISMVILDEETASYTKTIHLLLFIYRQQTFIRVPICFITVNIISLTPIWPSFARKERSRITFALCNNIQYHQKINNTIRGWSRGGVEGVATPLWERRG